MRRFHRTNPINNFVDICWLCQIVCISRLRYPILSNYLRLQILFSWNLIQSDLKVCLTNRLSSSSQNEILWLLIYLVWRTSSGVIYVEARWWNRKILLLLWNIVSRWSTTFIHTKPWWSNWLIWLLKLILIHIIRVQSLSLLHLEWGDFWTIFYLILLATTCRISVIYLEHIRSHRIRF